MEGFYLYCHFPLLFQLNICFNLSFGGVSLISFTYWNIWACVGVKGKSFTTHGHRQENGPNKSKNDSF